MDNFATEMLKELKANAKRWFIAFIVALVLWFITIGLFVWYINQPIEETIETTEYTQDANTGDNSSITQKIGD